MITRDRYVRDTYKELDISELPPGECLQLHGMVTLSSSDVSPNQRSIKQTPCPPQLSLIKSLRLLFQMLATLRSFAAPPFAPILAASLYLILVPTKAGSASASVPSTINSEECVRVQLLL